MLAPLPLFRPYPLAKNEGCPGPARDRILATAHRLLYREGIRATGIDRVIAESSVTKLTFYRNFPSKNDLIRDFIEVRHRGLAAVVLRSAAKARRHASSVAADDGRNQQRR